MSLIIAGGVVLPSPSSYKTGYMDITKSERNARGTMIMEFIARKVKIELSWKYLTAADVKTLLNAIDAQLFSVTYIDQQTNATKTGTFYKGDRNIPLFDFLNEVPRYNDITVNFIER